MDEPNGDVELLAKLTAEEKAFLDGPVEALCAMLDDWKITHELRDLPQPVWEYIKRERFFAMIIPKEYGGLGLSVTNYARVLEFVGPDRLKDLLFTGRFMSGEDAHAAGLVARLSTAARIEQEVADLALSIAANGVRSETAWSGTGVRA